MQRTRLTIALAVALAACAVTAGAASARTAAHIFNTRYCEVFELKTLPPNAQVVVWNTIGFSNCPAAQWTKFDAPSIAKSRGDAAVILNGPRYWLLDAATGKTGGSTTIGGLRFRKVATISIPTVNDLVRMPYSERTIERHNTWAWSAGRTVYDHLYRGSDAHSGTRPGLRDECCSRLCGGAIAGDETLEDGSIPPR